MLIANGLKADSDVFLNQVFRDAGAIRMIGARITGMLSCRWAQLNGCDSVRNALTADRMKAGGVYLWDGLVAAGAIRLLKVGGGVSLGRGFTAMGAVQLTGADITGTAGAAPCTTRYPPPA